LALRIQVCNISEEILSINLTLSVQGRKKNNQKRLVTNTQIFAGEKKASTGNKKGPPHSRQPF
jgi:hypothetical protein